MIQKDLFKNMLAKDMSRKQFLQVVGAGVLGIIGFTNFINNLDKFAKINTAEKPPKNIVAGYGSSAYGR